MSAFQPNGFQPDSFEIGGNANGGGGGPSGSVTETLGLSDALAVMMVVGIAVASPEAMAITDQYAYKVAYQPQTVAETVVLSDQYSPNIGYRTSQSDTLALSDVQDDWWGYARAQQDSVSLSDQFGVSAGSAVGVSQTDTLALSDVDAVAGYLSRSDACVIALSDQAQAQSSAGKSESDALLLSDSFAVAFAAAFSRGQSDTLSMSDSLSGTTLNQNGLPNTLPFTLPTTQTIPRTQSEAIVTSDAYNASVSKASGASFYESITLGDLQDRLLSGAFSASASEAMALGDSYRINSGRYPQIESGFPVTQAYRYSDGALTTLSVTFSTTGPSLIVIPVSVRSNTNGLYVASAGGNHSLPYDNYVSINTFSSPNAFSYIFVAHSPSALTNETFTATLSASALITAQITAYSLTGTGITWGGKATKGSSVTAGMWQLITSMQDNALIIGTGATNEVPVPVTPGAGPHTVLDSYVVDFTSGGVTAAFHANIAQSGTTYDVGTDASGAPLSTALIEIYLYPPQGQQEELLLSDGYSVSSAGVRSASESLGLTDSFAVAVSGANSVSEPITLSDSLGRSTTATASASEALSVSDAYARAYATASGAAISEPLQAVDAFAIATGASRTEADATALADSYSATAATVASASMSESLAIADAYSCNVFAAAQVQETLTQSDSYGLSVAGAGLGRTESDSVTLADGYAASSYTPGVQRFWTWNGSRWV